VSNVYVKTASIWLLLSLLTACAPRNEPAANAAVSPSLDEHATEAARIREPLTRFFEPMIVQPGDWIESHPENGETFEEYVRSAPTLPTTERKTIYIQPIGKFTADQKQVIRLTADYMKAFYNLPVVLRDEIALGKVSDEQSRVQYPNNRQIRTSYFFDLLPKLLPTDAAALICFTNYDLYPEDTWNYVFGQASLENRIGVWSLWRLEKENGKPANKDLFLDRTLKVAMHETGHMFSMRHCTKFECLMSGTNHLGETDRRPLDTCPECTAKIVWGMNYDVGKRYKRLAGFWKKQGRTKEHDSMLQKARAIAAIK